PLITSKVFGHLIDSIVSFVKTGNGETVWFMLAIYISISLTPDLIGVIYNYTDKYYYIKFNNFIELFSYKKRGGLDIAHIEDPAYQDLSMRAFNNGVWPILNILESSYENLRRVIAFSSIAIAIMLIDWRIFVITVVTAIPIFLIELSYGGGLWNIWGSNGRDQRLYAEYKKYFTNKYSVIESKLFKLQNLFFGRMKGILDNFFHQQIKLEKKRTWLQLGAEVLAAAGLYASLFLAISQSMKGLITIGTVVFLFSSLNALNSAATELLKSLARQLERNLYASDIYDVFHVNPVVESSKNPKKLKLSVTPKIEFKNVSFKYPNTTETVLEELSFTINPGDKIAFIGHNGAGKTTILRLLLRIHDPSTGEILINGVNLRELDLHDWWKLVGVLPQDYSTFNFSAKESIAFGDADRKININDVKNAAKLGTANEYIESWSKQYDTMIGVEFSGEELSKGEKQKMALARVFYRDAKVYILDEPTAAVDAPSASRIFRNIENLPKEKSVLLISHNFATLRRADRIILLDNKRVRENGTHEELMARSEVYAKLYNEQKSEYD
ncbi:MAG: ABC transporter ATP-binding protein, partial [bacterium]